MQGVPFLPQRLRLLFKHRRRQPFPAEPLPCDDYDEKHKPDDIGHQTRLDQQEGDGIEEVDIP